MSLYLVRHGETDWNREKRFQSRSDIPLNAAGRAQARRIATCFSQRCIVFQCARSSPLERAAETARIVLENTATALVTDQRLTEIALGDFEGCLESDLRRALGTAFDEWRRLNFTRGAPHGETVHEAIDRAAAVLGEIGEASRHGDVLIVAHQGINMAMMAAISGCSAAEDLAGFKQRNDQVEVWDTATRRRVTRFEV